MVITVTKMLSAEKSEQKTEKRKIDFPSASISSASKKIKIKTEIDQINIETQTEKSITDAAIQTDPVPQPQAFMLVPATGAVSQFVQLNSNAPVGYHMHLANFMPSAYNSGGNGVYGNFLVHNGAAAGNGINAEAAQGGNAGPQVGNVLQAPSLPAVPVQKSASAPALKKPVPKSASVTSSTAQEPLATSATENTEVNVKEKRKKSPKQKSSSSPSDQETSSSPISDEKRKLSQLNKEKYLKLKQEDPIKYRFTNIRSAVCNEITNKNLNYQSALESAMEKLYAPKKVNMVLEQEQLLCVDKMLEKWLSKKFGQGSEVGSGAGSRGDKSGDEKEVVTVDGNYVNVLQDKDI